MFSNHTKLLAGLTVTSGLGWASAELTRPSLPVSDSQATVQSATDSGLDRVSGALAAAAVSGAIFTAYRASQDVAKSKKIEG